MNGFKQINAFYSWVFNNPAKIRQSHISLYIFLINQNNRSMWVEWFKCPFDLAMQGSCIGSKSTYYNTLNDLQEFGLLEYKKGENNYKAPLIKLICLYKSEPQTEQVTVPLSEPQTEPQSVPLSVPQTEPQTGNIYKLVTNNIQLLTDNEYIFIKFLDSLKKGDIPKKGKFNFSKSLISNGADAKLVSEWLEVRKQKKCVNTETALKNFLKEVELSKKTIDEILNICVIKSWGGFEAKWIEKEKPQEAPKSNFIKGII